jgi:hypothetical protein
MTEPTTERRTVKVSVLLTPTEAQALDTFREANHWTRSTAAQVLITEGLDREKER